MAELVPHIPFLLSEPGVTEVHPDSGNLDPPHSQARQATPNRPPFLATRVSQRVRCKRKPEPATDMGAILPYFGVTLAVTNQIDRVSFRRAYALSTAAILLSH
ncbi:hypothetical protein BDW72DRAFT_175512 [Aspergillus terricola var. indicus]